MRNLTTNAKTTEAGAMEVKIYKHGEALIKVRYASVALTPEELRALYIFLEQHYKEEGQENHG